MVYLTHVRNFWGFQNVNFCCEARKEVNVPERVAGLLYEERLVGGFGFRGWVNRGWKW